MMNNPIYIKATKIDIPFDYWKHPKINNINLNSRNNAMIYFDNLNNSLIRELYQNESVNSSNGFLLEYRNIIYITSCLHGVKDCYNIKLVIDDHTIDLNIVYGSEEFDLVFMTPKEDITEIIKKYNINVINFNDLNTQIPKIKKARIITNKQSYETKIKDICEEDSGNTNFTIIPQINLVLKKQISNLFGISGSPCYSNDTFLGYVFSYNPDTNEIKVIPSYCVKYALEYMMPRNIKFLKTIVLDTSGSICSIYDNEKDIKNNAYKINEPKTIEYKEHTKDKLYSLKKNTLIFEIDNLKLNTDGKIYFEKMDIYLSPNVYILLNNDKDYFNFKGYELVNGNYNDFSINLYPIVPLDFMVFSPNNRNKIVVYKNMVFSELNRELLSLTESMDSKIVEKLQTPYSKKNIKQLVLIDILDKYSDDNSKLDKLKKDLETNLIFLSRINKKIIDTLEGLSEEINNNNESNFTFEVKKSSYKNLVY
jgi:hypothetical protein